MEARRTGGDDHTVDVIFGDVLLDFLLSGVGAGVPVPDGNDDVRQLFGEFSDFLSIHRTCDVETAVANKTPILISSPAICITSQDE